MKVGDIVTVKDWSASVYSDVGDYGHSRLNRIGKEWEVVCIGGVYPTLQRFWKPPHPNDVKLRSTSNGYRIAFVQSEHCVLVNPTITGQQWLDAQSVGTTFRFEGDLCVVARSDADDKNEWIIVSAVAFDLDNLCDDNCEIASKPFGVK